MQVLDRYLEILKAIQTRAPELKLRLELSGLPVNFTGSASVVVRDMHQRYPGQAIRAAFSQDGWIKSVSICADQGKEAIAVDAFKPSAGPMSAQGTFLRPEDTIESALELLGLGAR